jgi:uncharacterized glyoxalase superfamily protein PhnB
MTAATFVAPDIVPFMRYRDAPAAIERLERAFGFEKVVVYEGEGGTIAHAVLRFGTGAIQLSSPRGHENEPVEHPMGIGGLYLVVDDPDAAFVRAKEAGAEITRELGTDEIGRGFSVRDPEGNNWSFGTYRPGSH